MTIRDTDSPIVLSGQSENPKTFRSASQGDVSILDLLIVLGAGKKFVIVATLIAGIAAALISFVLPNRYAASTTLLTPQSSSSSALISQLGGLGSLSSMAGGLGLKNPADMYVSLLKSRSVEDAMIRRFQLATRYRAKEVSYAREKFERVCMVEANPKDGLIKITIEDRDPKFAAEMANAYVEEYKVLSAGLAVTEASQRRLFYEKQLEAAKTNLASAEEGFKQSEQTSGMIHLDSQSKALIEAVSSIRGQIISKDVQIAALSASETSTNPEIVLAKEQRTALQSQLTQLGGNQTSSGSELILPRGKIPEAGLTYARKLRDVKYYETIFELISKQYEIAKLDEARQGSVVQVVDPAVVPDRKSSPNRILIVIVAMLATFVLAVFAVLFKQSLIMLRQNPESLNRLEALRAAWKK